MKRKDIGIERITALLERCSGTERNFPPTDFYNEGWMLRLVLDWLSLNPGIDHDLSFATTDKWYSEALLPSAFSPRVRGDKLAESWTHADGVIGDFVIGANREGDLTLTSEPSRFLVTEAKMFSKLSPGVTNASYFNQAARNVACIAEVIYRAQILPDALEKVGFYVIAPESRIVEGVFEPHIFPENVRSIVNRRVSEYQESEKDKWLANWFIPTLEQIQIRAISWKELLDLINKHDSAAGMQMNAFYERCLEFSQYAAKQN